VKDIVEQGIACVKAGAAIVHLHAYDEGEGRQTERSERVHAHHRRYPPKVDAIRLSDHPTTGLKGQAGEQTPQHALPTSRNSRARYRVGRVDPGSTNFAHYDETARDKAGFVYLNPRPHRHGLNLAMRYGFHPAYAIYEPIPATPRSLALAQQCPRPITVSCSRAASPRFSPEDYGVTAYLNLPTRSRRSKLEIAGLDVTCSVDSACGDGRRHVRVGLEDAPWARTRATCSGWKNRCSASATPAGNWRRREMCALRWPEDPGNPLGNNLRALLYLGL